MSDPYQSNYENLAIAIVKQAVTDSCKDTRGGNKTTADKFLKSDWCNFLVSYFDVDLDYFRSLVLAERAKKRGAKCRR